MALVFMSVGGALPFAQKDVIQRRILPVSIALTVIGSGIGAAILLNISTKTLQLAIALAMITVAIFSLTKRDGGTTQRSISPTSQAGGYLATFVLAVYGGFFSGGYVTMLTAVFVLLFGLTFLQAVATTKVINIFSSLVAAAIFAWRGVLDYKLGFVLGVTMFVGAVVGGHIAARLPTPWLRRVFLVAVFALSARMLFDFHR